MPAGDSRPLPPPLEPPPIEKRGSEQVTEMTDAPVEQQGVANRRKERLTVLETADSTSSRSESSTATKMGFVDVCTIPSENPEAEGRCRGGPVTLDLTTWDFSRADCRTK